MSWLGPQGPSGAKAAVQASFYLDDSLVAESLPSGESHEAMTPELSIDLCGECLT